MIAIGLCTVKINILSEIDEMSSSFVSLLVSKNVSISSLQN